MTWVLREKGKGCIFSAACQGKVRETTQIVLKSSVFCFAWTSHSRPSIPPRHTQGLRGKCQMGHKDLAPQLGLREVSFGPQFYWLQKWGWVFNKMKLNTNLCKTPVRAWHIRKCLTQQNQSPFVRHMICVTQVPRIQTTAQKETSGPLATLPLPYVQPPSSFTEGSLRGSLNPSFMLEVE